MKLHELQPALGSNKEAKRKGRGPGSGNGKTAGYGHKGQQQRNQFLHTVRSFLRAIYLQYTTVDREKQGEKNTGINEK